MQWLSKMSKLKGSFFLRALTVPSLPVKAPSVGLLYPFDKTAVVFVFRQDVLGPPGTHLALNLESPFFPWNPDPFKVGMVFGDYNLDGRVFIATYLLLFLGHFQL